jgi:hypothetical protein
MKKTTLLLVLSICTTLHAQSSAPAASSVPVTLGRSAVALTGPWKFRTGDDSQWANPNFDDSSWETMDVGTKEGSTDPNQGTKGFTPGWTAKGHPGYSGYAWYRLQIHLTGADGPIALLAPSNLDDSYQLFVNGKLIGAFGDFGGSVPTVYSTRPLMFELPVDLGQHSPDGAVSIAFRFYMAPRTLLQIDPGGMHDPPFIGMADTLTAAYQVGWENLIKESSSLLASAVLYFVFTLLILMLFAFDRSDKILLWPLAACAVSALYLVVQFSANVTFVLAQLQWSFLGALLVEAFRSLWLITWWAYFDLQDKKWIRNWAIGIALWGVIQDFSFQVITLHGTSVPHGVFTANTVLSDVTSAVVLGLLILIVWFGIRRSQRKDWMLILAVIFYAIPQLNPVFQLLHIRTLWSPFGITIFLNLLTSIASLFCFSFVLMRRFRNSQRRQQAIEEDIKQAQQVQQVLIPEELPRVPGLAIESEYRPAREVGGDFFQIIPAADDSVLIVVGDVTGKGLQAGMLVALIVGAIRTAVEKSSDPLDVLQTLNRRLYGRGNSCATALALRITADGDVTLANAGHLPPWLNGKEIPVEGALPLGMVPNPEFSVTRFQLGPNDRLMLLSDGVVEAHREGGQLFGFDRIRAMLQNPVTVSEVAAAAQAFGQQDDISVLSVTRTPVLAHAIA